ncbi:MAG TPA: NADP oxidoreductase [Chloroflexi bacterium]|nr:NADP oxidoreductase [Chloroflexota bacterium]
MTQLGTESSPVRVAVIGAGPAGFYTAEHLLKQNQFNIEVDLFDRLPTPYGLVRGGVAPDHQKIKSVTKAYEKIAQNPRLRYFGFVEFGKDISLTDLEGHYHQIVFATGTQAGKLLNIPGAELNGSHAASDFVAWYNGHPDYRDLKFDLNRERVAVIGVGNVALDVARILCLTPAELGRTDIADYALEALSHSSIKEVHVLGRRGPAQAAFTSPEIKELGQLEDTAVFVPPDEAELDPLSQADLDQRHDQASQRKVELIQEYAGLPRDGKSRQIILRFLVSPEEILGDASGQVVAIRLVKNTLTKTEAGTLRPQETDQSEEIPVELVFHSIGYRGVPLPGVPFNERWGVIPNQNGRILDPQKNESLPGLYTAGWIKRGPSGVIGTNKLDASDTVKCMLADLEQGIAINPSNPQADAAEEMIRQRQPEYIVFDDWLHLDQIEVDRGEEENRPRVKFTDIDEMLGEVDY